MAVNSGIVPLAVLSVCLLIGGLVAIYITRKTARVRLLRQIILAQREALLEEQVLKQKPTLTDIYIGPPPPHLSKPHSSTTYRSSWLDLQPISAELDKKISSPHPHRTIENKPGYKHQPLIDGNVINVAVFIAMPSSSLNPGSPKFCEAGPTTETLDYCIGTSPTVVCTLLAARQRLVGFN